MQCACAILYCHLRLIRLYRIFPHCLINGRIFGKTLLNMRYLFWSSVHLSETFIILKRIRRDIVINIQRLSSEVPVTKWSTRYQVKYPLSREVSVIKWRTRYQVKYPLSSKVSSIKWSTRYQVKYPLSSKVLVIKWNTRYQVKYPLSREVPVIKWSTLYQEKYPLSSEEPVIK